MTTENPPLAVLVKGWPRLSETFIAQELVALEEAGLTFEIWSLRHPTDVKRHPLHDRLQARVRYLPEYLYQEPTRVWQARRVAVWVGLTSMGGSFCWFWAFTLQNAAYVKALGQIELLLSLLASVLFFKEQITRREIVGMGLLILSILALLLAI